MIDQLACGLSAGDVLVEFRIGDVLADMVLDQLRRQSADSAPDGCDEVQDLSTGNLGLERSLDGLDLPLQASDAG